MQGVNIFFLAKDYIIADSIIELVLHLHVLERIVADEPRSKLIFIKLHEPHHESTVHPRGWLLSNSLGRSANLLS